MTVLVRRQGRPRATPIHTARTERGSSDSIAPRAAAATAEPYTRQPTLLLTMKAIRFREGLCRSGIVPRSAPGCRNSLYAPPSPFGPLALNSGQFRPRMSRTVVTALAQWAEVLDGRAGLGSASAYLSEPGSGSPETRLMQRAITSAPDRQLAGSSQQEAYSNSLSPASVRGSHLRFTRIRRGPLAVCENSRRKQDPADRVDIPMAPRSKSG